MCGGTLPLIQRGYSSLGLSPRVRGNLGYRDRAVGVFRSIPACAGEPYDSRPVVGLGMVYPRVCGGTPDLRAQQTEQAGLSPRVRGNLRKAMG